MTPSEQVPRHWRFLLAVLALGLAALACSTLTSGDDNPVETVESASPTPIIDPVIPSPTVIIETIPEATPTDLPDIGSTIPGILGRDVPIAGADHIEEGQEATDWNSDPPTSGQHYGIWAQAGFYDEAIPDGYLVHNMEHGYVIIYYNCDGLSSEACSQFKSDIESALALAGQDILTNTLKVVAVPRPGMGNPITYASWGHLYQAASFVPEELVAYVLLYRSNADYAPEWNLP